MANRIWGFIFLLFLLGIKNVSATTPIYTIQDSTVVASQEIQYDKATIAPIELDKNKIEDYQSDDAFNYVEALPEDNWWTRLKQWLNDIWSSFLRWILGGNQATGFWAVLIRLLPYLLIAGLIALIVWVFLKIDSGNLLLEKQALGKATLSDDEELIQHEDIQSLIDKALASGNYRLAIRFYYLFVLQKLSAKELIEWQVQKTNHDYIYEIKDKQIRVQFQKVTDLYDYIWYGNFDVDETAFAKAQTTFTTLNTQL